MNIKISEIVECLPEDQAFAMYYNVAHDKQDIDLSAIKEQVQTKIYKRDKRYLIYWKQIACILMVALVVFAWNNPTVRASVESIVNKLLATVTPVTDEVKDYVGKPLESEEYTIIGKDGKYYNQDGEVISDADNTSVLPDNDIVKKNNISWMTPSDISIFKVTDIQIPQIMIPNGTMAVFTNDSGHGWDLKAGDSVKISFEKYQHETISDQSLMVGCVQDGTLYEGEVIRDIRGEYTIKIEKSGTYNFYFIGLSSDPISIQSGAIEIN